MIIVIVVMTNKANSNTYNNTKIIENLKILKIKILKIYVFK